jgi:hypothetical protein
MDEHTYSEALLLAGECVAAADNRTDDTLLMDLCLLAGRLRGLLQAGEPTDSTLFRSTYTTAQLLLEQAGVIVR